MEYSGTWGTEVEIFALSHLLNIHIYVYLAQICSGEWSRSTPRHVDATLPQIDDSEMGKLSYRHYEGVRSIKIIEWSLCAIKKFLYDIKFGYDNQYVYINKFSGKQYSHVLHAMCTVSYRNTCEYKQHKQLAHNSSGYSLVCLTFI